MMYMIIRPKSGICADKGEYYIDVTDDMQIVFNAVSQDGVTVLKLDTLTRVTEMEVSYKEITLEQPDE